jgi:protein-S-isoprenylcysteine O-methyltransferase Ste14
MMIYVVIQFICIIYLSLNIEPNNLGLVEYLLMFFAVVIGLCAVVNMQLNNLNILPKLKENHQLRTQGIYAFARHPMYTSVLLFFLALTLSNPHWLAQLIMLILFIDLVLKSNLEEKLLSKNFKNYPKYQQKTGRFLPFL